MIKIGEFAKICNVSAQTLRYYDAVGLLKADIINSSSGYRFYSLDAVEKFKQILFYKDLGFSLEEIKKIQSSTDDAVQKMLDERKHMLQKKVRFLESQIQKIGDASSKDSKTTNSIELLKLPFEDDPDIIGKWELCGEATDKNDVTKMIPVDEERAFHKELFFLPGGAFVWNYCWTKGVVYWMNSKYTFTIPNTYRIVEHDGERYMFLEFMSNACIEKGVDSPLLLYRQVDDVPYTDRQARPYVDKTDLPFVEDEEVLGEWKVLDCVPDIDVFAPSTQYSENIGGYIVSVQFHLRGICTRMVNTLSGLKPRALRYTKGTLLDDAGMVAEEYHIKEIDGREFLFIQHKSGDYTYGGRAPWWFVFVRKEN